MTQNARKRYTTLSTNLSADERMAMIEGLLVKHAGFVQALNLIERCHRSFSRKVKRSALITGEPGAGKSRLFEYHQKKHYREWKEETEEGSITKKNILAYTLPSPITISSLIEGLLKQVGCLSATSGTIREKTDRFIYLLNVSGVELIMLDEFHNLIDPDRKKTMRNLAEWFKALVNEAAVPVVLFGLLNQSEEDPMDSREIIRNSKQLRRRFKGEYHLANFEIESEEGFAEFIELLQSIDTNLPFQKTSKLTTKRNCTDIFEATDGVMDSVMTLIRDAAELAIEDNSSCIERRHFAQAFDENSFINRNWEHYEWRNQYRKNPFG